MTVSVSSGKATVTLHPDRGGRIGSFEVDGLELLVTAGDRPTDWGCYVMAPFAGRIRNGCFSFKGIEHQLPRNMAPHAIHGTVFDRPWSVDEIDTDRVVLSSDLGPDWPFAGRVTHEVVVTNNSLAPQIPIGGTLEPLA